MGIWTALKSALAERLTSWVMIASRLLTFRRPPPFSVTTTSSFSALVTRVFIFLAPGGRDQGSSMWPSGTCMTLRWRELDSNLRFLARAVSVLPVRDRMFASSSLQRRVRVSQLREIQGPATGRWSLEAGLGARACLNDDARRRTRGRLLRGPRHRSGGTNDTWEIHRCNRLGGQGGDGRHRGTDGSNPPPSSGESVNFRSLARCRDRDEIVAARQSLAKF